MPTHFGPAAGPRQSPQETRWSLPDQRLKESYAISLNCDATALSALLPDGFELDGEPILTATWIYQNNIGWLAGRGYNMLNITAPTRYRGNGIAARGPFLLVQWENLADPIITGREQLGYSKIFCDLPTPTTEGGVIRAHASWMGYPFLHAEFDELQSVAATSTASSAAAPPNELRGTLHLRYQPRVGKIDSAEIVEPVITPTDATKELLLEEKRGRGRMQFSPTTWEDMPTQYHIVEGLRKVALSPDGRVVYRRVRGSGDLLEHRSLLSAE